MESGDSLLDAGTERTVIGLGPRSERPGLADEVGAEASSGTEIFAVELRQVGATGSIFLRQSARAAHTRLGTVETEEEEAEDDDQQSDGTADDDHCLI
ncbi:MAG: hypothetical protein IPP57_28690 [Candidatus Obscuribacter sp.]|nr:hypothetical protein [Candidatus Obscuribacter sp.]